MKKEENKRRRRRKNEEEKEKENEGIETLCKDACLEILLENIYLSWVRKTLTLQYMCILVGLS